MTTSEPGGRHVNLKLRTRRSGLGWGIATAVLVLVTCGYVAITDPGNRWYAVGVLTLLALTVPMVVTGRTYLQADGGVLVWQRLGVLRARLPLATVTRAELVTNRGGQLALALRASGSRRRRFVCVLVLSDYAEMSLGPSRLAALADALERWAPARARGEIPAQLRSQAAYEATGAGLTESPLAERVSNTWTGIGKAAGGLGSGSDLAT